MSTPVSQTPTRKTPYVRVTTPDLAAQMQHMIDLQYEQQKQVSQEQHEYIYGKGGGNGNGGVEKDETNANAPHQYEQQPQQGEIPVNFNFEVGIKDQHQTGQKSMSTLSNSSVTLGPPSGVVGAVADSKTEPNTNTPSLETTATSIATPNNTVNNSTKGKNYWANYPDHGVGQGTLFFSSPSLSTIKVLNQPPQSPSDPTPLLDGDNNHNSNNNGTLAIPSSQPNNVSSLTMANSHYNLGSYGALDSGVLNSGNPGAMLLMPPPPPPPNSNMLQQQQQQQQLLLQPHPQQGEHEFHYGNPDYHDPFHNNTRQDQDHVAGNFHHHLQQHQENLHQRQRQHFHQQTGLGKYCCCLWDPMVRVFAALLQAESLHRSFCYGAIDGMLTGSGIVSTFCGIGLLSAGSSHSLKAMVVVFTTATCFADSVCMALGHVWTTHVLSTARARERTSARTQLHDSKADAKGQLVDMLLAKGMLLIDAMSLADTLEGYPDLFISALTGDSLQGTEESDPVASPALPDFVGGDASHNNNNNNKNTRNKSYGRLSEYEMDPDAQAVDVAVKESRHESLFMMLGFSIFSIVPSLIFWWCAPIAATTSSSLATPSTSTATNSSSSDHVTTFDTGNQVLVSPITLVVSLVAAIMWCLGVWKSRFLDFNWMLFGIETVVVLLVCIMSAYGLGALLSHVFLACDSDDMATTGAFQCWQMKESSIPQS
jgi:hypothetical protein